MSELPKGWGTATIANLFEIIKEKGREGQVPYLEIGNIDIKRKNYGLTDKPSVKGCRIAIKNDVLISKVRPTRGALTQVKEDSLEVSSAFTILRNSNGLEEKFLLYFLAWNDTFLNHLGANCTGTMYPTVSEETIVDYLMPVAPLNEQRRIVAKLENLLHKVDACQERLEKIPTILKRFRQSVLAVACSGQLTADWRAKHPAAKPTSGNAEIPTGWRTISLSEIITDFQNGLSKRRGETGTDTVVLRLANIVDGKISPESFRYIKLTEKEFQKYKLSANDILIIRVNGSPQLVGNFILCEADSNWAYCDHLIRMRVDNSKVDSRFLMFVSQTQVVRDYINQNMVSSAGQNTISQTTLSAIPILLPPLTEQQEIVRRVEELFKLADEIESRYQKAKAQVDSLTQSILAKAFGGELVPQDPNDEPSSALLERIRAERDTHEKKSSKKSKALIS